jgi:transcriptional regulator CtsR
MEANMDEIYKSIIDSIAHRCAKAIIEQLIELGILAKEQRQVLLQRVDTYFAMHSSGLTPGHLNGKYHALHDATIRY